jgi:hypothetical protein
VSPALYSYGIQRAESGKCLGFEKGFAASAISADCYRPSVLCAVVLQGCAILLATVHITGRRQPNPMIENAPLAG